MLWTERAGKLKALVNGAPRLLVAPGDVRVGGEGGMLGLAIDPDFTNNRRVYTCFDTTGGDVKLVVWTVDAAVTTATRVGTLVAGIPENPSGRHSGCRPRCRPRRVPLDRHRRRRDRYQPAGREQPRWQGATGRPFQRRRGGREPVGLRWYTRGHRNVQGLAFRPGTGAPYSIEHGTDRDDEVNLLASGTNFGWNPVPGYDESKPMTFAGGVPRSGAVAFRRSRRPVPSSSTDRSGTIGTAGC